MEKAQPAVTITLDKERRLKMDLNAMYAFEEATGKSLFNGKTLESFQKEFTARDLRALLWACLLHEEKTLTIEQVGTWVNMGNIKEITKQVMLAFTASMPEGKKEAAPLAVKK